MPIPIVGDDVTVCDDVTVGDDVPMGGSVTIGDVGFWVRSTGAGLSPPVPSSLAPIGIPTRPTLPAVAIPVGDEAEAVGRAKLALAPGAQVPEAFPSVPPPSKVDVIDAVGGVPGIVFIEALVEPTDACGTALPKPEQIDTLPLEGPIGDTPDAVGLTPAFVCSVAPRGMPVGATGAGAPMPSGDAGCMGGGVGAPIGPTCAIADVQGNSIPSVATNKRRFILACRFCRPFL